MCLMGINYHWTTFHIYPQILGFCHLAASLSNLGRLDLKLFMIVGVSLSHTLTLGLLQNISGEKSDKYAYVIEWYMRKLGSIWISSAPFLMFASHTLLIAFLVNIERNCNLYFAFHACKFSLEKKIEPVGLVYQQQSNSSHLSMRTG